MKRRSADLDIAIEFTWFWGSSQAHFISGYQPDLAGCGLLDSFHGYFHFILWYSFFGPGINMYNIVIGTG